LASFVKRKPASKNFLTEDEIVDEVLRELAEPSIRVLKSIKNKDALIQFHHTVGRHIRNKFRLWDRDNPLTLGSDAARKMSDEELAVADEHPDQTSQRIIERVWERCCS
jgi:hypothetical protein